MKKLDIQVGDRVTFIYKNIKAIEIAGSSEYIQLATEKTEILKIERIGSNGWYTVYEKKTEILDEKEKEYLNAVIKPFKSKIKQIEKKRKYFSNYEYLEIFLKENDISILPNFKAGTMYKNMVLEKEYSLKELGLEE